MNNLCGVLNYSEQIARVQNYTKTEFMWKRVLKNLVKDFLERCYPSKHSHRAFKLDRRKRCASIDRSVPGKRVPRLFWQRGFVARATTTHSISRTTDRSCAAVTQLFIQARHSVERGKRVPAKISIIQSEFQAAVRLYQNIYTFSANTHKKYRTAVYRLAFSLSLSGRGYTFIRRIVRPATYRVALRSLYIYSIHIRGQLFIKLGCKASRLVSTLERRGGRASFLINSRRCAWNSLLQRDFSFLYSLPLRAYRSRNFGSFFP